MMSDRDNVIQYSMLNVDGGTLMAVTTVEHPAMPPVPKVIRMFNHMLAFVKQDGENVHMIDYEYANLKGYLPASLMNMAIASETAKEFTNMMKTLYAKQKQ